MPPFGSNLNTLLYVDTNAPPSGSPYSPVHTRRTLSLARQDRLKRNALNLSHKTCEHKGNKIYNQMEYLSS